MAAKTDAPRTINLRLIRAKHAAEELGTLPAGRFEREIRFINVSPQGAAKRLSAELLPWQEAYDSLEAHLYLPLKDFPVYQWFSVEEVCKCVETKFLDACKPTFKSTDANGVVCTRVGNVGGDQEMLAAGNVSPSRA